MKNNQQTRNVLVGVGVVFIVLSLVIAAMGVWEVFGKAKKRIHPVSVPGFQQVDLNDEGVYSAFYQHTGPGPMPVAALSQVEVSVMFKETYQPVRVITNTTGQTVDRFGVRGMPVFTFLADRPGFYTITADYPSGVEGPAVQVVLVSEAAANVKQTLIVTGIFFLLFLGLGIFLLFRLDAWAPKN